MFRIQMIFTARSHRMDLRDNTDQPAELILYKFNGTQNVGNVDIEGRLISIVETYRNCWIAGQRIVEEGCLHIFVAFEDGFLIGDPSHVRKFCAIEIERYSDNVQKYVIYTNIVRIVIHLD